MSFLKRIFSLIKRILYTFCNKIRLFFQRFELTGCYEIREEKKYIFIDVTEYFINDSGTGIQRVVKNVVEKIHKTQTEYEIREIYLNKYKGYFYCDTNEKVIFSKDDIFLGLDLIWYKFRFVKNYVDYIYKHGVKVWFFVYDLIPLLIKEESDKYSRKEFSYWLQHVLKYTGVITDSKAILDDIKNWISNNPKMKVNPDIKYRYAYLGVDFSDKKISVDYKQLSDGVTFLMVSTLAYRKKFDQVVNAFNILWDKGINVKLNLVGRPHYHKYTELINSNGYLNKKLFWYNNGINDDELIKLYSDSDAVIFASISEGFGLSLIEASYYKKPLIIRDIPVFREIAGDNAFYFSGLSAEELADKIEEWLSLYKAGKHPLSQIQYLSWDECAENIYNIITQE